MAEVKATQEENARIKAQRESFKEANESARRAHVRAAAITWLAEQRAGIVSPLDDAFAAAQATPLPPSSEEEDDSDDQLRHVDDDSDDMPQLTNDHERDGDDKEDDTHGVPDLAGVIDRVAREMADDAADQAEDLTESQKNDTSDDEAEGDEDDDGDYMPTLELPDAVDAPAWQVGS